MSLFDDIIKALPENTNLRLRVRELIDQNESLKTEVAICKDSLRQANVKIAALQKVVDQFTHVDDLDETAIKILVRLAQTSFEHEQTLSDDLDLPSARLMFYLGELIKHDYVQSAKPMLTRPTQYYLSQKALAFLHEKTLI